MVTTDYTKGSNTDTLKNASLSRYRLGNWMVDTLKNFFSDSINIKDERICQLLKIDDEDKAGDILNGFVRIEAPLSADSKQACTTPAILVSVGGMKYTMVPINAGVNAINGSVQAMAMYKRTVGRALGLNIAVLTESCSGTQLLTDIVEDFLIINSLNFQQEGMIQRFSIAGSSEVKRIAINEGGHAKDIYQITLGCSVDGALTWSVDTQGPTYRGVNQSRVLKQ